MKALSTTKLHRILDMVPVCVAYVDTRGRCLAANRAFRAWYGLTGVSVRGKKLSVLVGSKAYARISRHLGRVRAGECARFELETRHPILGEVQSDVTLVPEERSCGTAGAFYFLAYDLTDLNRARHTGTLLTSALDRVSDGVLLFDKEDRVLFSNLGHKNLLSELASLAVPGTRFEDLMNVFANLHYSHDPATRTAYVEKRSRRRLDAGQQFELHVHGAWLMVREFLTDDGGLISTYTDITGLKKTQLALEESEERYRALVDLCPDVVIVHVRGRIVFANAAAVAFYGVDSAEQLIGREPLEFAHPDDHGKILALRESNKDPGHLSAFNKFRYVPKRGPERIAEACYGVIRWKGQTAALVVLRDVTERETITGALQESEQRYRTLMELLPDAVIVSQGEKIVFANRVAAEIHGAAVPEDLIGRDFLDLIHPDDSADAARRRRSFTEANPSLPMVVHRHVRLDDGTSFPVEKEGRRILWNGRSAILGVFRDVSERRRIEQALRDSDELLRHVTGSVPALISYVTPDGRFRFVNEQHENWFGLAPADIVGEVFWDFLAQNAVGTDGEILRESLQLYFERAMNGEMVVFEGGRVYRDGVYRHVHTNFVPHFDDDGSVLGVCTHVYDKTDQKEREEELRIARDSAQRANQSKSRFLAAASHDLRQPLQALNLYTFALLESAASPKEKTLIQDMRYALGAMESVLNGLIDISKLDAGVIEPEIVSVPFSEILERLRGSFSVQAKEKGLDFRHVPSGLLLQTDPDLLSRILENLISNAIRHTAKGKILIGCRRSGGSARIEVWDTGCGIPKGQQHRIFEEFYQLENPARERQKGLGLGLAIVDRAARLLGHSINVRSWPGRGSVFSVTVPLSRDDNNARPPETAGSSHDLRGSRILVIEDDETVLDATLGLLMQWGAEVASARCGEEAMSAVSGRGFWPDLVISDFSLPDHQTGTEAINALRTSLGYPVAGLIITGDTAPARMREALRAGFHVLYKPVDGATLGDVVAKLIHEGSYA